MIDPTHIRRLAAIAALTMLGACLSPTLPLPPPDVPGDVSLSDENGIWEVRGQCTPGAVVLVQNLDTGVIAGTEDDDFDGRYFVRIEASLCDQAEVSQLLDNDSSDGTFFILETTVSGQSQGECESP